MKRSTRLLLAGLALLSLLTVTTLLTASSDPAAIEPTGATAEPTGEAGGPPWALEPELQASRDDFQARLGTLTERFHAAATQEEALATQREISRLKIESELAVMEIQARRARQTGKEELAREIEAVVAQIRAAADVESAAQAAARATDPTPPPASGR